MSKRDVLLQDINNLNYTGLCKDNKCKLKMKINGEFPEVAVIEKINKNNFTLTIFPPLIETKTKESYKNIDECLGNLIPNYDGITSDIKDKIFQYFNE